MKTTIKTSEPLPWAALRRHH